MNLPPPQPPERQTFGQIARKNWWLPVLALSVGIGGYLLGFNPDAADELNPGFRQHIDTLERAGNCTELQANFDRTDDADELSYIDDAMRAAGCYR